MVAYIRTVRKGDAKGTLEKILGGIRGEQVVRVGFPSGTSSEVLAKATYNEFGTSRGTPERPFMRNSMAANKGEYKKLIRRWAIQIVRGKISMEMALNRLGLKAQGDIQKEIVALRSPPNHPTTIARKGSSNPLIDTGEMRQKVTYKLGRD